MCLNPLFISRMDSYEGPGFTFLPETVGERGEREGREKEKGFGVSRRTSTQPRRPGRPHHNISKVKPPPPVKTFFFLGPFRLGFSFSSHSSWTEIFEYIYRKCETLFLEIA